MIYMHGFQINPYTGKNLYESLTEAESRAINVYYYLEHEKIFPWMWDWENYSGDNEDMYGRFYPEDWENFNAIKGFKNTYNKTHQGGNK
jgi:hypothetical protein